MSSIIETLYKQRFLTGRLLLKWDEGTVWFYYAIYFFICILAYSFYWRKWQNKSINGLLRFVLIALVLFIPSGFRNIDVGADTSMYYDIYSNSTDLKYSENWNIEPLFLFLSRILNLLSSNGAFGIACFSFITIGLIIATIYRYRDRTYLPLSILAFVSIYYIQSLDLLRIFLACSITTYFSYLLLDGKNWRYAIMLLVCTQMHYSTFCLFLPFGIYLLYRKYPVYTFSIFLVIFLLAPIVINKFASLLVISRYMHYADNVSEMKNSVGLMEFIIYVPVLILSIYMKRKRYEAPSVDLMLIYSMCFLFYGILSYYIPIGRLYIHSLFLFSIIIPMNIRTLYEYKDSKAHFAALFGFVYLLFRFHMSLYNWMNTDQLMPYSFLFD